jgi:two-component system, probable response regulator PhcQ
MEASYDYKKYFILYVDDEEKSLKNFARAYADQFRILTAIGAREGLQVLEERADEIGVLMTDQRMPGENGVWLLERARQFRPQIIRILATAYSDMEAAIAAVNTGAIYKYVSKPWDPPQLETTLKRGLEFFMVQQERDLLLQEKMSVLHNMMIADRLVSLGLLASGLSHHIRNALQAVRTFVDLAPVKMEEEKMDLRGLRNPEFWKEYYQNVQSQITKINNLLSELCQASQPQGSSFNEAINLRDAVSEACDQIQPELTARGIRVDNAIDASLPPLHVDKPKFRRLFELLLRDEAVTLPKGSVIAISAQLAPDSDPEKPEVEITIRDNGPGLPKEALRLVFDPFVVRNDIPTEYGIHLMGCFFIVHHHGGKIRASSEEGKGTTFNIRLPLNPERAQPLPGDVDFFGKILQNQQLWEKLIAAE